MLLDLVMVTGGLLSLAGLLYGAYLALMETEPFFVLFGKRSAAPFPLSSKDLRLIEALPRYVLDGCSLSGSAVMDIQHQGLFGGIDNLRSVIRSGQPVAEVNATIDALIRNVVQHFQDEEAILAAADYPGTTKHAALHRELTNSTATLSGQFRAGELGIGELFRFLARDVIARHMLSADREFTIYMENRH